jgi:hypothetical protein
MDGPTVSIVFGAPSKRWHPGANTADAASSVAATQPPATLSAVAASKGLGFFPQMIGGSENARRGEEIAARERRAIGGLGSMHHLRSRRV